MIIATRNHYYGHRLRQSSSWSSKLSIIIMIILTVGPWRHHRKRQLSMLSRLNWRASYGKAYTVWFSYIAVPHKRKRKMCVLFIVVYTWWKSKPNLECHPSVHRLCLPCELTLTYDSSNCVSVTTKRKPHAGLSYVFSSLIIACRDLPVKYRKHCRV